MDDTKKRLIVDNDEEFVGSNKELLEAYGYEVLVAYDGAGGLTMAKAVVPDLMILDVMMSHDTEGIEIARQLATEPKLAQMKVLLVSGIARQMDLPHKLEADSNWLPVHRILEKPVEPKALVSVIGKLLEDSPG